MKSIEIDQRNTIRHKEMELILLERIEIEKVRHFRYHNNQKTLTTLIYEKERIRNDNHETNSSYFILDMINKSDFKKIIGMLKTISTTINNNI